MTIKNPILKAIIKFFKKIKQSKKFREAKAKLLRFLHITKAIPLTDAEVKMIKFCKGHYEELYRTSAKEWSESFNPIFKEIYGWGAEEHKADYMQCLFQKLLDIYLKINFDMSGNNNQLKEVFDASFRRSFRRDYESPIERAIAELCGQIQSTIVIDNGVNRFYL